MSNHIERALLLIGQSRFEPAEKELRQELIRDPNNPTAHSLLALCLSHRKEFREALEKAQTGVGMAPDEPHSHYVLARVHSDMDNVKKAEESAREALRLDPGDPDYYALLSSILYQQKKWKAALDYAEQALTQDPKHVNSMNLRGMALRQLNRHDEAQASIASALTEDPENALSHASQGWSMLEQGDHRAALEHFREALRLDPEQDWAREGIIEALKAKSFIYRIMLKYFFLMSKLSNKAQWAVILGAYIVYRVLRDAAKKNPDLAPFVWPVLGVYIVFMFLTWTAEPIFNLLLRLNPFGRYALSRDELTASNWVGGTIVVAVLAAGAWFQTEHVSAAFAAVSSIAMIIPVSAAFSARRGKGRIALLAIAGLLAATAVTAITLVNVDQNQGVMAGVAFLIGIALFPWAANAISMKQ